MGNGRAGSFVSGFGMALASGLRQKELDEEARADRKMVREERQIRLDDSRRDAATRDAVAAEARPAQVEEGAGGMIRPATMDNRDVGLPENAALPNEGLSLASFRAAGKEFPTRPEAEAAATTFNAPEAVSMRQAGALRAGGKPTEAMSLENAVSQQRSANMDLADKAHRRRIGMAVQAGHDGLANLATSTEVGPFAGKKAKAVPSADGSTVTYHVVNDDGTTQPTRFTFPAGREGVIQAAYMMDQSITPEHRYTTWVAEQKSAAQLARENAAAAETRRHNLATEGTASRNADTAASTAETNASKAPRGFKWKADGTLEPIKGGPGDKAVASKPMPAGAAKGYLESQTNLRRAERALALVSGETVEGAAGDPAATGKKGWLPNQVLNRVDPAGVDTRAAIADLGSLVIHDRSGAAVTAAEFPRLAPFIPSEKDDAATVKKKLGQFVNNYRAILDDTREFYEASGYKVPVIGGPKAAPAKPGAPSAAVPKNVPRVASMADVAKLPKGSLFVDPNGVTRMVP